MAIRLRGHHLLCLLTYQGMGYTRAFTANYNRLIRRISAGEYIEIVDGPDEICTPLLCTSGAHCLEAQSAINDSLTLAALEALFNTRLGPGSTLCLTPDKVRTLRAAFASGKIRDACQHCRWHSQCSAIASQNFADTFLQPTDKESR